MDAMTFEEMDRLIVYDPKTGILRWKMARRAVFHKWVDSGREIGTLTSSGYRLIRVKRMPCMAHRVAWLLYYGTWPTGHVDHINCDKTDNRIANLRLANKALNGANRGKPAHNTSGFKGVTWDKRKRKWFARVGSKSECRFLGYYATPEAAHEAYLKGAAEMYGPFARGH